MLDSENAALEDSFTDETLWLFVNSPELKDKSPETIVEVLAQQLPEYSKQAPRGLKPIISRRITGEIRNDIAKENLPNIDLQIVKEHRDGLNQTVYRKAVVTLQFSMRELAIAVTLGCGLMGHYLDNIRTFLNDGSRMGIDGKEWETLNDAFEELAQYDGADKKESSGINEVMSRARTLGILQRINNKGGPSPEDNLGTKEYSAFVHDSAEAINDGLYELQQLLTNPPDPSDIIANDPVRYFGSADDLLYDLQIPASDTYNQSKHAILLNQAAEAYKSWDDNFPLSMLWAEIARNLAPLLPHIDPNSSEGQLEEVKKITLGMLSSKGISLSDDDDAADLMNEVFTVLKMPQYANKPKYREIPSEDLADL